MRLIEKVSDFRQEGDEADNTGSLVRVKKPNLPLGSGLCLWNTRGSQQSALFCKAVRDARPRLQNITCSGELFQAWMRRWLGNSGGCDYVTGALNTVDSCSVIQKTALLLSFVVPLNLPSRRNPSVSMKMQSLWVFWSLCDKRKPYDLLKWQHYFKRWNIAI